MWGFTNPLQSISDLCELKYSSSYGVNETRQRLAYTFGTL